MPPELDVPQLPECAEHAWRVFLRLSATRQNGMAANPISYQEMLAYSRMTGDTLAAWEVEAINGIDGAYLASVYDEQKAKDPKK